MSDLSPLPAGGVEGAPSTTTPTPPTPTPAETKEQEEEQGQQQQQEQQQQEVQGEQQSGGEVTTDTTSTPTPAATNDTPAPPIVPPSSSSSSTPATATATATAAVPSTPIIPDDQLTPDQLHAKKMFERWQRAFLGAVDKQPEEYILAMLREGEDLVATGLLDLNRSIKPASGSTFLHTVAWFQKAKIMEWLLARGANPNQGNLKGNTPLHLLSEQANKDIAPQLIQLMIDYGGDVELKDGGDTPMSSIEKAAAVGFDVMKLDFTRGKEYRERRNGLTQQGGAGGGGGGEQEQERCGMTEQERQIATEKAKLVYRKLSTLFLGLEAEGVSQAVDDAIVRILTANLGIIHAKILDVNAPPLSSEGNNKTFLHYAVIARRPEIVRVLILALQQEEGQLDAQDEGGETPLHYAIQFIEEGANNIGANIVAQLLEAGASTTVASYLKGLTPLQMIPQTATQETKIWIKEQIAKPKKQKLGKNALASKFGLGGGGGIGTNIGPTTGGFGSSSPLTPSSSSSSTGNPEKQDRAGARAMMARMASNLNAGMISGGGGMNANEATTATTATTGVGKSSALGLIQKASHRASHRASGGAGMSAALQQIMASKGNTGTNANSGSGLSGTTTQSTQGVLGLGQTKRPVNAKKLLNERALGLDGIFSILDLSETNTITPLQLQALYESMHSSSISLTLIQSVLEQVIPTGQCTRTNLLEVLSSLAILSRQQQELKWDFHCFDSSTISSLSTQDGTGGFTFAPAELVWTVNNQDQPSQMKYEDFLIKKQKQERTGKPKEVRWIEMQTELVGKLPNLG